MKTPRIILTCVGGIFSPGMISLLKEKAPQAVYLVGVDIHKDAVGFSFVDKAYTVPRGSSKKYFKRMFEIAIKEEIDAIIPVDDYEVLSLSEHRVTLERHGIRLACPTYWSASKVLDTGKMLSFLRKNNKMCPDFYLPRRKREFISAVYKLGYPNKKVVVKPRISHGAVGFWILCENYDKKREFFEERIPRTISLERLLEGFTCDHDFASCVIMEYLPGKDFNVDVLANNGEVMHAVINERLIPDAGPLQKGHVYNDKLVYKKVEDVVKIFKLNSFVNVELAYREGKEAIPLVYEINPRVSAAVVASESAGINLLWLGVQHILGKKIPKHIPLREVKMSRYWAEAYQLGKERFNS